MTTYRTLPRYANSDLGEFRQLRFSLHPKPATSLAQQFGTQFHAWLLEGQLDPSLPHQQQEQLAAMRKAALKQPLVHQLLTNGLAEQVQLWTDPLTGLPCKAQTDLWLANSGLLVDIKTTNARTYREFLASCVDYRYDRQAAYYLDGTPGARRFVFIGVQKQPPFQTFYFEATDCPGFVEGGRKQYRALLSAIQRVGFIPSSWQRTYETN
jgi:hypothetical protein